MPSFFWSISAIAFPPLYFILGFQWRNRICKNEFSFIDSQNGMHPLCVIPFLLASKNLSFRFCSRAYPRWISPSSPILHSSRIRDSSWYLGSSSISVQISLTFSAPNYSLCEKLTDSKVSGRCKTIFRLFSLDKWVLDKSSFLRFSLKWKALLSGSIYSSVI